MGAMNPETNWETRNTPSIASMAAIMDGKLWPTPTANEDACGKSTGKMQAMLGNHPQLGKTSASGSLNPAWVEWLMGYPKDWKVLENFASGRTKTSARQESAPESSTASTA